MNHDTSPGKGKTSQSRFSRQWNYRPEGAIQTSPLFQWPLDPAAIGHWFAARWLVLGENVIIAGLAMLTWYCLQPSLEITKSLEFTWIALMFLRNTALIVIVAGGLHFFLHTRRTQGDRLKFDPEQVNARGRRFTFHSQLRDNMVWTLGSGVFFWTAYEVLMLWAMANGHAPMLLWTQNPLWFIALFFLTPLWISFHFYWIHRFLHWPPLYRMAHSLHHRNTNIGPWSGLSMHPLEHILFFSSILIHWLVAAHPVHILFHMQHQALTAATSHAGFEAMLLRHRKAMALGNFHHQMHHRYFECNYGSLEVPWDKVFGSFHDGTEQSHEQFTQRRRKLAQRGRREQV
ncbi:sterol desaturase family protein [Granulosicoccus sp. 3-233]|uniref:sterol desaturase family protein n=1 Tax=Granulosicoccus sp. 3-233 TaxID=3417969 RepID=UPI003D356880